MQDEILQIVKKFADEKADGKQVTVYHLLSGYIKLLTMNTNALNVMFSENSSMDKVKEMYNTLESENIDIQLMRQAFPLILVYSGDDAEKNVCVGDTIKSYGENSNSVEIFKEIMKLKLPELELVKKGRTLNDTLTYVEQRSEERAAKEKEAKEAKKAAAAKAAEEGEQTGEPQTEQKEKENSTPAAPQEDTANREQQEKMEGRKAFQDIIMSSKKLYSNLLSRVKGQDEAIRTFVEGYFQSEVFRAKEQQKKPSAVFLFAGPPGVGKTYLAETAAEFLGLPFARFDMSEYCDYNSNGMFAGDEKKYTGAKPGAVTSFVAEHPRSVILFDEIEKAHVNIIFLFLQILDGGILTDNYTTKQVSFKDTILLFTTNVGRSLYEKKNEMNLSTLPKSVVLDAIKKEKNERGDLAFPSAICSRFASGNVVMFNHLETYHLVDIVQERFEATGKMAKEMYSYNLMIDPRLSTMFLFNQGSNLDARTASSQSSIMIKNELYEFARHVDKPQEVFETVDSFTFTVDIPKEKCEVRDLFINSEQMEVLCFADAGEFPVAETEKYKLDYVQDIETAKARLQKKEYSFVLTDLMYGGVEVDQNLLSLDDYGTQGIAFFKWIRDCFPSIPVYILEQKAISMEDKATFLQRGARGFVAAEDKRTLERELDRLADIVYLQHRADELSNRHKILSYNTMQYVSEDKKRAFIKFYDFKIKKAVTADAQDVMMAENQRPTERFSDVFGAENAKEELRYFVDYMRSPKKYIIDGVRQPKGILLYGPPGTGKTMLAKAMAGESNASFFPVTATGFMDKYVGESERKIRDLFAMAKNYAPAIIFIDEIDAIGKERTGSSSTAHTESMLNALLTEMDGFEVDTKRPVFVLAATNFDLDGTTSGKQSAIDPALLRRFDNRIYVDLPNEEERKAYLQNRLEKYKITTVKEGTIDNIAKRTTGESLAILQNVFELAVRNARKKGASVTDEDLLNALEEYMYGEKHEWDESYYKEVSIHESGHALVHWLAGKEPSFVTIVSRGNFGGYMMPENGEKTPNRTKEDMIWHIRTCLAGRAAELVFYGEKKGINTGVSSDLKNATSTALHMLNTYGMGDSSMLAMDPSLMQSSPERSTKLLEEADAILKRELPITMKLIEEHRDLIEELSGRLMKKNQLVREEILEVFEGKTPKAE